MRRIAILLATFLLVAPVTWATAQEAPSAGSMLIILDASGSMNNVDEDGVPFIDKAKNAVLELIDALPDDMAVGLRVYGHREPNTDPVRGCQDTELLAPVTVLDRDAIRDAVAGVEASGFTPIGLALREAADDLPDTGPRSIVLISDGEDTCAPPDPCQIAEELFGGAIDVRIESVGFLIDTGSAAEQQLRCIAESTGGSYTTVGRADALIAKLGEVAASILDWNPPLTLHGALERSEAPALPLALIPDWLAEEPPTYARSEFVSLLMPGETRWFEFELWENEGFWSFADLEWPAGVEVAGEFEAIVIDPAGNRIDVPAHPTLEQHITLPGADSPMIGVQPDNPPRGPRPAGTYLLGFHWDAPADVFLGQVRFSGEILGDGSDVGRIRLEGSPDPAAAPVLDLLPRAENGPEWNGNLFWGPIAAGETRWYRLDLEPGEEMNAFALFPGDRVAGSGVEGEFGIELRDLNGEPIGGPHDEQPQMRQAFGFDQHQARVSATTERGRETDLETILVEFWWDGPVDGTSEIRFEVETIFSPERLASADERSPESENEGEEAIPTATPEALAAEETDSGSATPGFLIVGATAIAIITTLVFKRRNTGRRPRLSS